VTVTPARLEVLNRCTTGKGLIPLGPDWFAIYWLRENGYVVRTSTRPDRYSPTARGSNLLKHLEGSNLLTAGVSNHPDT
jgi:hypothetical protein